MPLFKKEIKSRQVKQDSTRRSPITNYYRGESNDQAVSPFTKRQSKKPVRRFIFAFLDVIIGAALIFGLIYSLMLRPDPKLLASSTSFHSLSDYHIAASEQLARLGNRNKITFNQKQLAQALQKKYPEIDSVQVELPLLNERPTIRLTISPASFFLISQGVKYVISESGFAVGRAADLPQIKGLLTIDDQSGFKIGAGRQVLGDKSVAFIKTVLAECKRADIQVTSLSLPAKPQEMDLRVKNQPYFVKFYLGGDALIQAGQFLAARAHFDTTNQQPASYLDVRVAGKIFYK